MRAGRRRRCPDAFRCVPLRATPSRSIALPCHHPPDGISVNPAAVARPDVHAASLSTTTLVLCTRTTKRTVILLCTYVRIHARTHVHSTPTLARAHYYRYLSAADDSGGSSSSSYGGDDKLAGFIRTASICTYAAANHRRPPPFVPYRARRPYRSVRRLRVSVSVYAALQIRH